MLCSRNDTNGMCCRNGLWWCVGRVWGMWCVVCGSRVCGAWCVGRVCVVREGMYMGLCDVCGMCVFLKVLLRVCITVCVCVDVVDECDVWIWFVFKCVNALLS